MIIAIEGTDGVGKTTLAAALAEHLHFELTKTPIGHLFGIDEGQSREIFEHVVSYQNPIFTAWFLELNDLFFLINSKNKNIIIDRHILLNVYWNYNETTKPIFDLSINYAGKPDLILYLTAKKETIIERLRSRDPDDSDLKTVEHIDFSGEKSIAFLEAYNYRYEVIPTDGLSCQEVFELALEAIDRHRFPKAEVME